MRSLLLLLLPWPALLAPQYPSYPASNPSYPASYPSYQDYYPQSYSSPQTYSYPSYPGQTYQQQAYPSYPVQYPYSYPTYAQQFTYPTYPAKPARTYQDPVYNYMLNDLSYFGPEVKSTPTAPPSPPPSAPERPAWQGKVEGRAATRCHDGQVLPFRARCDGRAECRGGEDELGCDWHKGSSVPTVSSVEEFKQVLQDHENVLVEFFAPWCPACVTFLPHLEELQEANTHTPLTVVKVNTDEDPELKEMFSVNTFPRVMLWSKRWGSTPDYLHGGHRTYEKSLGMSFPNIQAWLTSLL